MIWRILSMVFLSCAIGSWLEPFDMSDLTAFWIALFCMVMAGVSWHLAEESLYEDD